DGNPLFLEQLLAFVAEEGLPESGRPLPATIQALLAARLDRLGPGERAVLTRAAVIGKEFRRVELDALLEPQAVATADRHLQTLEARSFVVSTVDGFRFGHVLIQEAAYRSTPKQERGPLHERFADWLDGTAADDADEFVGYHLEQAHRFRVE